MIDLSRKTICVYDISGSFTHVAEAMAKSFGRVCYQTCWQSGFSVSKDFLPGMGLDTIERIADFWEILDDIDLFFFTDVGHGALQEYLRERGMPVFGCGAAQLLEIDRWYLKQALTEAGMDVIPGKLITGVDKLRAILKAKEELYVKGSYTRGDFETFHHKEWFSSETWVDNLAVELGPYSRIVNFVVEESVEDECAEPGCDTFAVDGELPENIAWGYECKDAAFVATTDPLPECLAENVEQFATILKQYNYRGPFSTEVKCTEDKRYMIDATMRCPSPPSEIQCALIENLPEVVWEAAHGRLVEPTFAKRYAAQIVLKSDWVVDHPIALELGYRERLFIHGHFQIEGKDYAVVPEAFPEFGGAVGTGDTLEAAIAEAFDAAESVKGHQVRYDESAMSDALEDIEEGEKFGLSWVNAPRKKAIGE